MSAQTVPRCRCGAAMTPSEKRPDYFTCGHCDLLCPRSLCPTCYQISGRQP